MEWTGATVRALRLACRLSQEEFAELLGASPRSVRHWESGTVATPSLVMRRALDTAWERASEDQRQSFWSIVDASQLGGQREQEIPTQRRQALRAIGGALGGAMVPGAYLESIELDRQVDASDLGPATLEQLDLTVERLGLEYIRVPLASTLEEVRGCRRYVARLLNGRQTLAQRTHLYEVAGWLSILLGQLAFDLGQDSAITHRHLDTSLHLAEEAGAANLAAWARGTQALEATFAGNLKDAVAFARAGQQVAPVGSAAALRLWANEARAYARMGEAALAQRAMGTAESAFEALHHKPTFSILSFDYSYLPYYAGTIYNWLGIPKRAQECAEQAIVLRDVAPKDNSVTRVLARVDLAAALGQQGDLEGMAGAGAGALKICATGRRTALEARRLAELLRMPELKRHAPALVDLEDHFHTVFPDHRGN